MPNVMSMLGSGWLPESNGYVLLAACRPSESAYEYPFEGTESNGALTYSLLSSLKDMPTRYEPGITYKQLHDRIRCQSTWPVRKPDTHA